MLSTEEMAELLRQDADAFRKDLEKLNAPQELHRQFEQVMERLEREGPGKLEEDEEDEDDESEPNSKMLSAEEEEVEKLVRENAQRYIRQFQKTPQELRQWFDRMIEQLEREGFDEPEEDLEDEDDPM